MKFSLRRHFVNAAYRLIRAGAAPPVGVCASIVEVSRLRQCLQDQRINCVLDVGANAGQFVTRLRRLGFKGWIFSFEPNPDAFAALQHNHGHDRLWRGFPFALGALNETREFNMLRHSPLSSFLAPVDGGDTFKTTVTVRRLDSVLDEILTGISAPRVLLKMDTQGWDPQVVDGAGDQIGRIAALLSELSVQPLYHGMTPYYEALRLYSEKGFVLYDVTPINFANNHTVIECDCLMVRR